LGWGGTTGIDWARRISSNNDAADYSAGDTVSWQWGDGTATGKVTGVFPRRVQRTFEGAKVVRNGTPDNPALTIEQENGSRVLKLASEVSRSRGDASGTGKKCGASYIARWKTCRSGIGGGGAAVIDDPKSIPGVRMRVRQYEATSEFIEQFPDNASTREFLDLQREGLAKLESEIDDLIDIEERQQAERIRQNERENWESPNAIAKKTGANSRDVIEFVDSARDENVDDIPVYIAPDGSRWRVANEEEGFRSRLVRIPDDWNPNTEKWEFSGIAAEYLSSEWISAYKQRLGLQGDTFPKPMSL
jgi:hypothetical protein